MSNKLKVCAYCRVSTGSEEQETSYNHQLSYFKREITKAGHKFMGIYGDKGLTGTKLDRTEFEKMLHDGGIDVLKLSSSKIDKRKSKIHTVYELSDRDPLFNEIWIKNTSRFARNTLSFEIIDKLRNKGVNIYFIEQRINTRDGQDLMLKMFQMFDEQDSRDKSLKVISGIRESAKNNSIRTTSSIYGYKYYPMPENKLEIVEDEAETIRIIYDLYSKGYGYRRIINHLTENNLLTRQGKPFCPSTIKRILTNEKYTGHNALLKYDCGTVFNRNSYAKVKDNYDIVFNSKIPAIVSKELFDMCKEQTKSNSNEGSKKGVYHGISKYAGILVCGKCFEPYTANIDKGRKFYNCKRKKYKGTHECNNENISLVKLESLITAKRFNDRIEWVKECNIERLKYLIEATELKRNKNCSAEILDLEIEKDILNDKVGSLIDQLNMDNLPIINKRFNEEINKIGIRLGEIDIEIENFNSWNKNLDSFINEVNNTINELESIEFKEEYSEDELFEQIHKIIIENANNIIIHYNIEDKINSIMDKYIQEENSGTNSMDIASNHYLWTVIPQQGEELKAFYETENQAISS